MDNKQKQKHDRYHTEKQWRSFGYALKKDAKEVRLFTPSRNYTYFSPDDVVFQPELCKLVSKLEYDISVKYDIISRQDHPSDIDDKILNSMVPGVLIISAAFILLPQRYLLLDVLNEPID